MKNIIYILFLIPFLGLSQISGTVGNGIADDTGALQSWLDSGSSGTPLGTETYLISSTLYIDGSTVNQVVDWNGATITTNTQDLRVFFIDKNAVNGGTTYMNDLLIDGNNKAGRGMEVSSRVEFTNIDGQDYSQTEGASSPAHIYARYDTNDADSYGNWIFDGCDADHLVGYGTWCDYCDGTGVANGYLVAWKVVPTSTTVITFKNATVTDGQGPDGQNVGVFSSGLNMSYTLGSTVFDNITTSGFDRRGWKIFCGNVTVKNCLIQDNLDSDGFNICGTVGQGPGYCSALQTTGSQTLSSGLVAVGRGSGATGGDNILFENVTFVAVANGTDDRVIPVNTTDMTFNNCTFSGGAKLAFTRDIGDIDICGTDFGAGSITYDFNEGADTGTIRFSTNNTYVEGNFFSSLNDFSYTEPTLSCPPVGGGGGAVDNVFWNDDIQDVNIGITVDTGHYFDPTNPDDNGFTLSSDATGVLSNAGVGVSAGTANFTITADDTTNGTKTDVMAVTVNASDTDGPVISGIEPYDILTDRFKLTWSLDEPSKGWVFWAETSQPDYPTTGAYDQETDHEESFTWSYHIQTVGGNTEDQTDVWLKPSTLYYCRIYAEDIDANVSYSDEFTVRTLGDDLIMKNHNAKGASRTQLKVLKN